MYGEMVMPVESEQDMGVPPSGSGHSPKAGAAKASPAKPSVPNADARPKWSRHDISEDDARWFRDNSVVRIDHKWAMTGADTSRNWLELSIETGPRGSGKYKVGKSIERLPDCVRFTPSHHARLLELDSWVAEEVDEMDKWDKRHAKDVAELKRLQRKLYGTEARAEGIAQSIGEIRWPT